ncbi:MAG: efflux RND transporter periplasmic adaptor subunit [Pseudomonadales bacterium]
MQKNLITALVIAVAVLVWLFSGVLLTGETSNAQQTPAEQKAGQLASRADAAMPVRVRLADAEPRQRVLVMRGKTLSKREVDVAAEVSGAVVARPVERGQRVKRGDLLCELAVDDRSAAVAQAQAELRQAQIEYQGTQKLRAQGLQSETATAAAAARLESAKASLQRQQISLRKTRITAPFAGVVDRLHMHVGDYAGIGGACVTLIDLDPMLVTADLSEHDVEFVQQGSSVSGKTSTGQALQGTVTFVASQSDTQTRTYPMEVTVDNSDYMLKSGLTTTLEVKLNEVMAHLVSPALFALNDRGEIGLRLVDDDNVVRFHPVTLVEDTAQGAWVTGLPAQARLITVGQDFVVAGQTVDPVLQNTASVGDLGGAMR